jgi:two-component system CheB/CheR fusion protein
VKKHVTKAKRQRKASKALSATSHDITESKRAEEDRKRLDEELRKHPEHFEELIHERTIELSKSEEAARHLAEQLTVLDATVLDTTKTADLPSLFRTIVERAVVFARVDAATLYICEPEQQVVRCVVAYNTLTGVTGTVHKYGEGAAGTVAKTGQPLIINDYRTWPGRVDPYASINQFRSFLSVPLIWHGKVTGVINIISYKESHRFTQDDLILLTRFANHAAIAVERKKIEDRLRESEEKYRTLVLTSPDAVTVTDLKGIITDVSAQTLELHGFSSAKELLGKNDLDLVAPEDREKATIDLQRTMKKTIIRNAEYLMLRKDGTRFPAERSIAVIEDAEGKPKVLITTTRDITDRKRMSEAIDLARQYAENIVSTVRDPMIVLDSGLRIISANRSFYQNFKVNPTETEGKSLYEIGDRQWDNPDLRRLLEEILPEKSIITDFELTHAFPTIGQRVMLLNARKVVAEQHGKSFILLAIEDITERKRLEELREQFLSHVTHELRTPLGPLKVHVEYALAGKLGPLSEKLKSSLQVMKMDTDRLMELTDQVLDIRRFQSGKFEVDLQSLDLREIINQSLKEAEVSVDVKKQHLHVEIPDRPLPITGDATRLSQVMTNLLSNASKFTPENGQITVKLEDKTDAFKVTVYDTGIGIRKDDLSTVFLPFAAIQKPTWMKGAGLGLSISKGIVEAHSGKIWAESDGEGKGASFIFTLPKLTRELQTQMS